MSIMGVSASLYYLNIVSGFPFVRAYYAGYWLPRLVQPALLCFVVMAFHGLGWLASESPSRPRLGVPGGGPISVGLARLLPLAMGRAERIRRRDRGPGAPA